MAIFKKDSSKLSKKLLSIALAATMMCGTGTLAGTVATVSNLPVSAATANIVDGNGDLASLAVNTVFTAAGVTYKITSVGDSVTAPKAMITSIDEDYFLNKNTLALATSSLTVSYKDTAGKKQTTAVTIAQVGDGTNSLVASWSTANKSKFKSVQVGSQVEVIAKNAFKDVFRLYDAEEKGSTKPVLTLGNSGDHYGMALTTLNADGLPTDNFIVETVCLNVPSWTSNTSAGYLTNFNNNWTYRAYWGSYAWSKYVNKCTVNGENNFEPINSVNLSTGITDSATKATFAFYILYPTAYMLKPTESYMSGEWKLRAYNAGTNKVGWTADNYNTGYMDFAKAQLKSVCDLSMNLYKPEVSFVANNSGALSGSAVWDMSQSIVFDDTDAGVAAKKNIIDIFTRVDNFNTSDISTNTSLEGLYALNARIGYNTTLGYKLAKGRLLIAAVDLNNKYYNFTTGTSGKSYYNVYVASKEASRNTQGTIKTGLTFAYEYNMNDSDTARRSMEYPVRGTYAQEYSMTMTQSSFNSPKLSITSNSDYTNVNLKLYGLTKDSYYQIFYTTAKSSGVTSIGNNDNHLNSWTTVNITPESTSTSNVVLKNKKYYYTGASSTSTSSGYTIDLNNVISKFDKNNSYQFCVKLFNKDGKEMSAYKSYGLYNSGQMIATLSAKDYSKKGPVTKYIYNTANVLSAYKSMPGNLTANTAPTLHVGYMTDPATNGWHYVQTNDDSNYKNYSTYYIVNSAGVVRTVSNAIKYTAATAKRDLLTSDSTTTKSLFMYGSVQLPLDLADGKYTIYVGQPTFGTKGTSWSYYTMPILNPDALVVSGTATVVHKVGTINVTTLGLKFSKAEEKAGTGVGMTISTNGITKKSFILQEKVTTGTGTNATTSWVDVDMPTTAKTTASDGTVTNVSLSKTGFTTASASILPNVGTHTYRIKAITNNSSFTSNEQTVTITAGYKNYPTIKLGANTAYNGSATTTMKNSAGVEKDVFVPKSSIKTIRMTGANPSVAVELTKIANADVYGLGTGKNVSTTFYIANGEGCVASKDDWGDAVGSVVLSPNTTGKTLAATAVVDSSGKAVIGDISNGFYPLKTNNFIIKAAGQYFVKAISTFKDSSGADQKATRYYFFKVTE